MSEIATIAGWLAALMTLGAYSMRTMLPLRTVAICANIFFIIFSAIEWILPTLVLHAILLPFNCYRLWEIVMQTRMMRVARTDDSDPLKFLEPLLRPSTYAAGDVVFRIGDPPDNLFYLKSGRIRFDEVGAEISDGALFGEIAFFSDQKRRTATATCLTDCEVMSVDEAGFMRLFYQNPAFGLYVMKLAAKRLIKNADEIEGRTTGA
ncbi:MAG: cyclic nucleotide-binding domain-containing protein [Rhodobacteraceae bacterium]|nr:cyclic nucleotide-binding domain-containing protein [Paracoccaceae bacterium]